MTKHANILASITRWLDKQGIFWIKIHGSPYQRRGLPDLLVIHKGKPYFFEIKPPGSLASEMQLHQLDRIRKAGAIAEVVRSQEMVQLIIFEV